MVRLLISVRLNAMKQQKLTFTAVKENKNRPFDPTAMDGSLGVMTYHSRAGIRDLSLEGDPLVVGPLFVSKGPQKGPPDVIHGVETHSRALKHTAAGAEGETG